MRLEAGEPETQPRAPPEQSRLPPKDRGLSEGLAGQGWAPFIRSLQFSPLRQFLSEILFQQGHNKMLDLLIVAAFILYGLGSGLRARGKASQSLDEYFLAGKTIKGWKAGFSMGATQFAADTPLLVTGLVATAGIFALWRLWIYGLAFLLMAFIFAVGWRRAGVLTDAELTRVRYSGKGVTPLRLLKAIYYGTVINCVVLAMVLVAAIRIAEVFLPWHSWLPAGIYEPIVGVVASSGIQLGESITGLAPATMTANNMISILLILAFTAMYSITGGLRAVVQTDVVQFSLAMIGTLLYAWFVVDAAGGLGGLTDRLVELYGSEQASKMLSFAPSRCRRGIDAVSGDCRASMVLSDEFRWYWLSGPAQHGVPD